MDTDWTALERGIEAWLVWSGPLDVIDDDDVQGTGGWLQL
jgi:hypothetical protein